MNKLTKAEELIMHKFWEKGEATVSNLISDMPEPKPPHSSISSIVRILEKKGFVNYKAYGRTHLYFPIVKKEDYTKRSLSTLVTDYFHGSFEQLVSFIVKEKDIDAEELKRLIDQLENNEE